MTQRFYISPRHRPVSLSMSLSSGYVILVLIILMIIVLCIILYLLRRAARVKPFKHIFYVCSL